MSYRNNIHLFGWGMGGGGERGSVMSLATNKKCFATAEKCFATTEKSLATTKKCLVTNKNVLRQLRSVL